MTGQCLNITSAVLGDNPRADLQITIDVFFRYDSMPARDWPYPRRIVLNNVQKVEERGQ